MKLVTLLGLGLVATFAVASMVGCRAPVSTSPAPVTNAVKSTPTNSVRVAPVKLVKNDPDHVHILLTDGTSVSFVYTNTP